MAYDYDMIVIGGGAGGLTAAGLSANLGARTMLVERDRLGGDCTWTGCIPSKTLLKASRVAQSMREASRFGLFDREPEFDFGQLMRHVRQMRTDIYEEADHPDIFRRMGIEILEGYARFEGKRQLRIDMNDGGTRKVSGRYFIIAAGSKPFIPSIDGIEDVIYLTSESLFEIEKLPEELLIVGAGPIGIEMSQAFSRFGSDVKVIDQADQILPQDDPEMAQVLEDQLQKEGIRFFLNADVTSVKQNPSGRIQMMCQLKRETVEVEGDRLLMATGRRPDTDRLGLGEAGVETTSRGVAVNKRCRTSQRHIFACGDVTGRFHFTHMSEHMAKVAVSNALLKWPRKIDEDHVPWCTFTEPEVAQVGKRERELMSSGKSFKTYRFTFDRVDRAITDGRTEGLIKVHTHKNKGRIEGVSIVGANAGEMISEYALALRNGVSVRQIADTIHPYPTYGLGNRRAADQWYVQNQSEWMIKLLKWVFGYRGSIPDLSDPDRIM